MKSQYEMEELVPIVAKLAAKYAAGESTSVTYERAQGLMEAVLYCIREAQREGGSLLFTKETGAQQMYETGYLYVEEKVRKALRLYNEILPEFVCYGNKCLHSTFVNELPEFFKWYDILFEPQNTILTLDYPVLRDISQYTGIDRIYEFIRCVHLEQKFLSVFPEEYVKKALSQYDDQYEDMVENICEIVFMSAAGHILADRKMSEFHLEEADCHKVRECLARMELSAAKKQLMQAMEEFVKKYCEGDGELLDYLGASADGILIRLKNAAECGLR